MKVLGFAQEVNHSAQCFYEEMAVHAENDGVSRIFHMLASEEKRLAGVHGSHAGVEGYDSPTLDKGVNVFEQLRRLEDHIEVADDVAAYRLALDAEKDVLHQYETAAEAEDDPELKELLCEIAEEERQLLEEIENLYDFSNAPNNYLAWGEFSNLGEFSNFGREIA
ncbi:MAG: ferritin-like domain-containing protein [Desulfuromonadales bacterium]